MNMTNIMQGQLTDDSIRLQRNIFWLIATNGSKDFNDVSLQTILESYIIKSFLDHLPKSFQIKEEDLNIK